MRLIRSAIGILLLTLGAYAFAVDLPQKDGVSDDLSMFALYSVDTIYSGKAAKPDLTDKHAAMFRSRLRDAMQRPVNFAGEYVLTTWGCGTACVDGAVVSLKTGKVVFLPDSIDVGSGEITPLQFFPDSRLLLVKAAMQEGREITAYYYEFSGSRFNLKKQQTLKNEASTTHFNPMPIDLERLYFKQVDMSQPDSRWLVAHAPEKIADNVIAGKSASIRVRMHQLPAYSDDMQWAIIEIRQTHGRVAELWWTFYRNDQRQSVWHFTPPANKRIAAYHIIKIEPLPTLGEIAIQVTADQFLNAGIWSMTGKRLFFSQQSQGLHFKGVENSHGYFATDTSLIVSVEKRNKQSLEEREIRPSAPTLAQCGYQDPRESMNLNSWRERQSMAACLVNHGSPVKSIRPLHKASFVEKPQN